MAKYTPTEPTQDQIQAAIEEFESKLERLRVRYEQFFMGIERVPPAVLRTDVNRVMRKLESTRINNTAQKFRIRGLVQKFHTYSTYWNRTMRQIENGTYPRHLERAKVRGRRDSSRQAAPEQPELTESEQEAAQKGLADVVSTAEDFLASIGQASPKPPPAPTASNGFDVDDFDDDFDPGFGARPKTGLRAPDVDLFGGPAPLTPTRATPPFESGTTPPNRHPPRGLPNARPRKAPPAPPPRHTQPAAPQASARPAQPGSRTRKVYDEYVAARDKLGLAKGKVGFEKFERSLAAQAERVKKSHKCRDVDFQVVVKDGQAILKPVPKR